MRRALALFAGLLAGCHSGAGAQPPAAQATVATSSAPLVAQPPAVVVQQPPVVAPQPSAAPVAPPAAVTPPPATPPPSFVVRYVCDDKYDEGATCRPGQGAWATWFKALELSEAAPNLLKLQGGGPSGAEWNPAAPLVAFVASLEPGRARLKSSRTTFTPVARFGDYDVFLLPLAAWTAAARRARAGDFPDGTVVEPLSVVELRANDGHAVQRGLFVFSSGE